MQTVVACFFLFFLAPLSFLALNFNRILEILSARMIRYFHKYNKKIRPKRIILVRHGQSEANVDCNLYKKIPDSKISLTSLGKEQAKEVGTKLKELVGEGSIKFYVSPYLRSKQTYENILLSFKENTTTYVQDPRLREQEFGNYHFIEDKQFEEISKVGRFYYRFTEGENGADVYDRASQFLDKLFRDIKNLDKKRHDNIIIVCHALFMKMFMMNFLEIAVDDFDSIEDPKNCDFWVIEKNAKGKYKLKTPLKGIDKSLLG